MRKDGFVLSARAAKQIQVINIGGRGTVGLDDLGVFFQS